MRDELKAIMGPIGIAFEWRSLDGARGSEPVSELVVVSFKGECEMRDVIPASRVTGALGWTHMTDGELLPFSDVDCERIRRFIGGQIAGESSREQDRILGRAMGRVLAHELYHVFADTTRHGAKGVAKGFYTAKELVADHFRFEDKETNALRRGKLRSLLNHRPAVGSGSAQ